MSLQKPGLNSLQDIWQHVCQAMATDATGMTCNNRQAQHACADAVCLVENPTRNFVVARLFAKHAAAVMVQGTVCK